jgi:hypothetical protein
MKLKSSLPTRCLQGLPLLGALLLSACGNPSDEPAQMQVASVRITGQAVDGPLQGATACYDVNDNGGCDSDEPTAAPTGADGRFAMNVSLAQAGRHRVVVDVPATAVDADTAAPVGMAYTLVAPATGTAGDHSVFVSPLSTLVQAHADHTGATLAAATALVQAQAGLAVSPLDDFITGSSPEQRHAALVARLVQQMLLMQHSDLAAVVGTPDRTGSLITTADLLREVQQSVIGSLPAVAAAAAGEELTTSSGPALQAAVLAAARHLATQAGLSAALVRGGGTAMRLEAPPVAEPTANLTALQYTDANNWFMRTLESSPDDNVADAQNYLRFRDVRRQSAPTAISADGVSTAWANSSSQARAGDLHWNGAQWVACPLLNVGFSRVRDAQGRSDFNYCDSTVLGTTVRRLVDISGKALVDVVRDQIRSFPGSANGVSFATWGPADLGLYGAATFPAGSQLIYNANTATATAAAYDVLPSNVVRAFNAAVAAGGDARVNPSLACNDPAQTATAAQTDVTTLEELVARNSGTPCTYNVGGVTPDFSLNPNEWWGNSSVNLGDLANTRPLPADTGNYYNTTASLRVSFAPSGSRVTFYNCYRRASDGSPRNCTRIGIGSRSIQTLGDARVMSFTIAPALAQRLSYNRVFIERGGKVYYGYKNPVGRTDAEVRLNLTAANAVLLQLGLPRILPVTTPGTATGARAANLATLKGVWGDALPDGTEATVLRFGDNGRVLMAAAKPEDPFLREKSGLELGWLDHDPTTLHISALLELDTNLTSGLSHPNQEGMNERFTITPTRITSDLGVDTTRLETTTSATSLVGLWAFDSPTDLSVHHMAFFSNGRFMVVTPKADTTTCPGVNECPPGVEFGQYTYDAATGALSVFSPVYDTNGCEGVFETCPSGSNNTTGSAVITIDAGGTTATLVTGAQLTFQLYRVPAQ